MSIYHVTYAGYFKFKTNIWDVAADYAISIKDDKTMCIEPDDYQLVQIWEYTKLDLFYNKSILPLRIKLCKKFAPHWYIENIKLFLPNYTIFVWSEKKQEFVIL